MELTQAQIWDGFIVPDFPGILIKTAAKKMVAVASTRFDRQAVGLNLSGYCL